MIEITAFPVTRSDENWVRFAIRVPGIGFPKIGFVLQNGTFTTETQRTQRTAMPEWQ